MGEINIRFDVLSLSDILSVFKEYKELSNTVEINGIAKDRHWPSFVGHFLLSKFTEEEMQNAWNKTKKHLPPCELVEARVLKYSTNSHIPAHKDEHEFEQSDLSVIVQLNHPDDYTGGDMVVEGQLISLKQGDMIYYGYDAMHGVHRVKQGSRYVLNFRCKTVK
ncbi:2OG-Fe(II) oxygenase [bacterium]|nr:2OG-Fe(II) oxygenase [bacterium]